MIHYFNFLLITVDYCIKLCKSVTKMFLGLGYCICIYNYIDKSTIYLFIYFVNKKVKLTVKYKNSNDLLVTIRIQY